MASPQPKPTDYRTQQAIVMQRADRDIIRILKRAQADINKTLRALAARRGIGARVETLRLQLVKRELQLKLAETWRKIGDVIEARRLESAARVLDLNRVSDELALTGAGLPDGPEVARAVADAELDAARTGLDRMIARTSGSSYVPLSQRVYASTVVVNGAVDRLVSSALARGLSARDFAKEVSGFINPNTPGGVRYAAMRLARTEINNAAHALAIDAVRDKPWVTGMKWHLSSSHPRTDVCNSLASGGTNGDGIYAKDAVPSKPHPHCFCYVTPETPSDEEFLDNLIAGHYNSYIEKYRNIQPGQVVRSNLVGGEPKKVALPPAPPKKAPAKRAPAPAKATKAPVKRAAKAAPAPVVDPLKKAARAHVEPFWQKAPLVAREAVKRNLNMAADRAPRSMVLLRDFTIEDRAGTIRLRQDANSPNALGGYTRGLRTIRFADETIGPLAHYTYDQAIRTGWWSHNDPGHGMIDSVTHHEFGHHLDQMVRRLPIAQQERFWNEIFEALGISAGRVPIGFSGISQDVWDLASGVISRSKSAFAQALSTYGAKNSSELLAEIWQENMLATGTWLRPHIKRAGEILLRYAESGAAL